MQLHLLGHRQNFHCLLELTAAIREKARQKPLGAKFSPFPFFVAPQHPFLYPLHSPLPPSVSEMSCKKSSFTYDWTFGTFDGQTLLTIQTAFKDLPILLVWWSGVVVSTLALINEVNLRRARLVLRWVTVSGSIPGAGHIFQYVTNQPPKANSAFHPSGVGKWVPASAGKAKAGMVHSVADERGVCR